MSKSIFSGISLPDTPKLTAEDFLGVSKSLSRAATSVGEYLTGKENERVNEFNNVLAQAQYSGDTETMKGLLGYSGFSNSENMLKAQTATRGAIEDTALNSFNLALERAKQTGDLADLDTATSSLTSNLDYLSPSKEQAAQLALMQATPQIEESAVLRSYSDYVSQIADQENVTNKDAIARVLARPEYAGLFTTDVGGGLVAVDTADPAIALKQQEAAIKLKDDLTKAGYGKSTAVEDANKAFADYTTNVRDPVRAQALTDALDKVITRKTGLTKKAATDKANALANLDVSHKEALNNVEERFKIVRQFGENKLKRIQGQASVTPNDIYTYINTTYPDSSFVSFLDTDKDVSKVATDLLNTKIGTRPPTAGEVLTAIKSLQEEGVWSDKKGINTGQLMKAVTDQMDLNKDLPGDTDALKALLGTVNEYFQERDAVNARFGYEKLKTSNAALSASGQPTVTLPPSGLSVFGNVLGKVMGTALGIGEANASSEIPGNTNNEMPPDSQQKGTPKGWQQLSAAELQENYSDTPIPGTDAEVLTSAFKNTTGYKKREEVARSVGGPENFYNALEFVESHHNPNAISRRADGSPIAWGVMQLEPATAMNPGFNVPTIFDVATRLGKFKRGEPKTEKRAKELLLDVSVNRELGRGYIDTMLERYDWDIDKALTAYNMGPGKLDRLLKKHNGNLENVLKDPETKPEQKEFARKVRARANEQKLKGMMGKPLN